MRLYRVAGPGSARRHRSRTLAWMVLVWALALVGLPAALRAAERRVGVGRVLLPGGRVVGTAVLSGASALGLWCALTMARGEGTPVPFQAAALLVEDGPYRHVRNPMAVSGVAQAAGVALLVGSPTYYLVPLAGTALWQLVIRPSEERFLADRFGAAYRSYRGRVPLWLPHRLRRSPERWVRRPGTSARAGRRRPRSPWPRVRVRVPVRRTSRFRR